MNVLVCASSPSHGLSNALRSVLSPFYTVQSVRPVSLTTQPWTTSCALLVLLPPFSLPSPAHEAIQQYISAGGRILGIGIGATLLPHRREHFGLWDARSGTAIVPQYPQAVSTLSLPSSILLQTGALLSGLRRASVPFVLTRDASDIEVIRGRWEEPVGAIAGIQVPVGSGRAAFWGISPCFDGIEDTENVTALLRYALTSLGLSIPPPETTANESSSNPLFSIPKYALPQFLLHPRGKRHISETILQRLGLGLSVVESVDTFHFHKVATLEHGARLVAEAKAKAKASADASDASDAPRLVVVLPPDVLPNTGELTPRFDAEKYFAVLAEVRGNQMTDAESWGVGEALFYGEAVTSTQTMLERNPRFLASLQAPIVSLATFQLSGRGRGSNTWLSPTGCLQFSILVRAPLGASGLSAPRLVFVQYLVGLAIVRACRDERALGAERGARVRLKWPNDVYIDLLSSSSSSSSSSPSVAGGEKKKVGGILINMSFADGNADVIIGCGINVSTPAPVTALDLLCRPGEHLDAETVLALVLTEFERLWTEFVAGRGSWAPFEEAYLDMWMHSDQLVTLTTVDPPVPVRIVGITHEHGLLRTIPERTGWGRSARHGVDDEYIDLQPDGNSFDIMMGLIKAKK
ncbi:class II aaRS and biotin synthetase [Russula emetica]|nr:class II aaRS and biotin synthetase [Russula emetica]